MVRIYVYFKYQKDILKLLNDVNNLHRIVDDILIEFVKEKSQPFLSNILKSKEHFWSIGRVFKFCMTFVFLIRYVLGYKSQHQWRKFSVRVLLHTSYIFSVCPTSSCVWFRLPTTNSTCDVLTFSSVSVTLSSRSPFSFRTYPTLRRHLRETNVDAQMSLWVPIHQSLWKWRKVTKSPRSSLSRMKNNNYNDYVFSSH